MIYANGIFIAVSPMGNVLTSLDGINWTNSKLTLKSESDSDPLQAIAYGNGIFVTVSSFGRILALTGRHQLDNCSGKFSRLERSNLWEWHLCCSWRKRNLHIF